MKYKRTIISCVLILLLIYLLYPSQLEQKYNQVKVGDTFTEVKNILDMPDDMLPTSEPNQSIYIWLSRKRHMEVSIYIHKAN